MAGIMQEIGVAGLLKQNGVVYEEFLKELRGRHGIEVYTEMSENDDIVGAVLYSVEMLIRQASWYVQPASDSAKDKEAAEFVDSCLYDMQNTWTDTLSEILSFLTYGWSYHEIVYKRRMGEHRDRRLKSTYSDGLIGWQKLPIRAQSTLKQWEYDESDNLVGMTQYTLPDYGEATIPIDKALHFRTKSRRNSPEGRSILRNAYRSWYFKRRMQELEGIGIERDLAGLPVITAPTGCNIWNMQDPATAKLYASAMDIVTSIRRDSMEGIVLPGPPSSGDAQGWKLELLNSGGQRQFDTNAIIERYDTRIAMCTLADFVLLGHQKVGSFALSSDKTELFSMAIGAYLDIICEVFNNQAIPRLIALNSAHFGGITGLPTLAHGDVESPNIVELSTFIKDMVGAGVLTLEDSLEDYVREQASLPERTERKLFDAEARALQRQTNDLKPRVDPEELEPDNPAEAEAARKRLEWRL